MHVRVWQAPGLASSAISLAAQFEVIVNDKLGSGIHWQM